MRSLVKVQKNKNITLPTWAMRRYRVVFGDYLQIAETSAGLVLRPVKVVDADQAYFWSKEWQEGEAEAERDIKAGKVKRIGTARSLRKDLLG
jgi:antitoxin MazE